MSVPRERRPRVSHGVRRALAHIIPLVLRELERPLTGRFQRLRAQELHEIARAVAWLEWHRLHNTSGRAVALTNLEPRRTRRHPKPTAPQQPIGI